MNKFLLALSVLTIISLACGATAPSIKSVDDYLNEFGGNRDVYNTILSLSDCTLLQEQFNIAADNNQRETAGTSNHKATLGYMTAADDRMKALDCYGQTDNSSPTIQDLSIIVAQTAEMALTQTALFIIPTLGFTSTNLPTLTQPVIPTPITIPTSETTPIPTNTTIFILPTPSPLIGGTCPCSGDTLNCGDFTSQSSAQACMNYCIAAGAGDIHNLDGNANGQACEASF